MPKLHGAWLVLLGLGAAGRARARASWEELVHEAANDAHSLVDDQVSLIDSVQRKIKNRRKNRAKTKATPKFEIVLGVVTNPRTPQTRLWIRNTYLRSAYYAKANVLARFVLGNRGLSAHDKTQLDKEQRENGDIEYVDASDFAVAGGIYSCIDKLFAWFRHAPVQYPGAKWYVKADDDSFVDLPRLAALLQPASGERNVYAGFLQYDSLILDEWKHCGWGDNPIAAVHGKQGCPSGRTFGPFPFVVGALTVMGRDLAYLFSSSTYIENLVDRGRATQGKSRHWDCGYSDVTLGYALASTNISGGVTLISLEDAFRDATYKKMDSNQYVVSHHLRSLDAFERAASGSTRKYTSALSHCAPWGEVHNISSQAHALKEALGFYRCCQSWRRCEIHQITEIG